MGAEGTARKEGRGQKKKRAREKGNTLCGLHTQAKHELKNTGGEQKRETKTPAND